MEIELGAIYDHWKISYTVTRYSDSITAEEADQDATFSPRLKQGLQRHNL